MSLEQKLANEVMQNMEHHNRLGYFDWEDVDKDFIWEYVENEAAGREIYEDCCLSEVVSIIWRMDW